MTTWVNLTTTAQDAVDPHELTLVGKVLTSKTINFTAINAIMSSSWKLGPNVQINALDNNVVSCMFTYPADRDRILKLSSWAVKGFVFNLLPWHPHLNLAKINFALCPLWVQIHHLPLNKMNRLNAQRLGDFIGKFQGVDDEALAGRFRKFIRIRVLVDTVECLKPGCMIDRDDGSQSWVSFKFERLPEFCYQCGKIDHSDRACPHPREEHLSFGDDQHNFGPWMRTQPASSPRTPAKNSGPRVSEEATPGQLRQHIIPCKRPDVNSGTTFPVSAHPQFSQQLQSAPAPPTSLTRQPLQNISNFHLPRSEILPTPNPPPLCQSIHPTHTSDTIPSHPPSGPPFQPHSRPIWPQAPIIIEIPSAQPTPPSPDKDSPLPSTPLPTSVHVTSSAPSHDPCNPCNGPQSKRKLLLLADGSKKSKHARNDEVHDCFAQLRLHPCPSITSLEDQSPTFVEGSSLHATIMEEDRVSIVRRRFLHVKRLARMTGGITRGADSRTIVDAEIMATTLNVLTDAGEAGDKLPRLTQ